MKTINLSDKNAYFEVLFAPNDDLDYEIVAKANANLSQLRSNLGENKKFDGSINFDSIGAILVYEVEFGEEALKPLPVQ